MIRYEFYDDDVSISNIHPVDIFEQEKELAYNYILKNNLYGKKHNFLFKRYNIPYFLDENKNLLADINLDKSNHEDYFFKSELAQLRATQEYQELVTKSRSHIWSSYIEWMEGRAFRYLKDSNNLSVLDVGSRAVGWIEALKHSQVIGKLSLFNSLPPLKQESSTDGEYDIVIASNVIQRELNPEQFVKDLFNKTRSGGIALFSFRCGTGFDVLGLRDKNKSIFPPDHLFLPSLKGIEILLKKAGFKVQEMLTPGQLDAEILKKTVENGQCVDPLLCHIVETVPVEELQTFIQKNNLSSHARIVVQKE